MNNNRGVGFTIVELVVTITILVILTTLAVARLSSAQVGSRDQERQADIAALSTGLESYYQNGDPLTYIPKGYYPGRNQISTASSTTPPFKEFLDGLAEASYVAPDRTISNSFGVDPAYATAPIGANPDGSYSDAQARALLASFPYLYQPLRRNDAFCVSYLDCVRFNLYYLHEGTNTVKVIRSKNQ